MNMRRPSRRRWWSSKRVLVRVKVERVGRRRRDRTSVGRGWRAPRGRSTGCCRSRQGGDEFCCKLGRRVQRAVERVGHGTAQFESERFEIGQAVENRTRGHIRCHAACRLPSQPMLAAVNQMLCEEVDLARHAEAEWREARDRGTRGRAGPVAPSALCVG